MTSICLRTPEGHDFYQAGRFDSARAAINESQRKALCQNAFFRQILEAHGLGHLTSDQISVSVDCQEGEDSVLRVWQKNTGRRIPIYSDTYSQNPFLLQYVLYQSGQSEDPPTPAPTSQPSPPTPTGPNPGPVPRGTSGIPKSLVKNILAAQQKQMETFQEILAQHRDDQRQSEERFLHVLDTLDARAQQSDENFRDLLNANNGDMAHVIDRADARHVEINREMHARFGQMQDQFIILNDRMAQFTRDMEHENSELLDRSERRLVILLDLSEQRHMNLINGIGRFMQERQQAFEQFRADSEQRFANLMREQREEHTRVIEHLREDRARADGENRVLFRDLTRIIRQQGLRLRRAAAPGRGHRRHSSTDSDSGGPAAPRGPRPPVNRPPAPDRDPLRGALPLPNRPGPAGPAPHHSSDGEDHKHNSPRIPLLAVPQPQPDMTAWIRDTEQNNVRLNAQLRALQDRVGQEAEEAQRALQELRETLQRDEIVPLRQQLGELAPRVQQLEERNQQLHQEIDALTQRVNAPRRRRRGSAQAEPSRLPLIAATAAATGLGVFAFMRGRQPT